MKVVVPFTLKFLSDKTTVSKSTIREWLKREVITAVGENEQGYPVFDSSSVERVMLIKKCRKAGYKLSWIDNKSNEILKKELEKN